MGNLLYSFLEKRGVKSRKGLTPDERATFEKWENVMNKEIRAEDVVRVCSDTIEDLQKEWLELEETSPFTFIFYWKQQLYIKARIKNLMLLKQLFQTDKNNKKALENYLKDLLKK